MNELREDSKGPAAVRLRSIGDQGTPDLTVNH